jgi:hypothetical protein
MSNKDEVTILDFAMTMLFLAIWPALIIIAMFLQGR